MKSLGTLATITCNHLEGEGEFEVNAYLGRIDTLGKREIHVINHDGNIETWFLFPGEYEIMEEFIL